jgi:hypothetical protein
VAAACRTLVDILSKLSHDSSVFCSRRTYDLCHACQLGRHIRLPFLSSNTRTDNNFDLIHCDLWTSPVVIVSGYKYYLVILDDHSHFVWTFSLRVKSDIFSILSKKSHVSTQFGCTIKVIQCDNGHQFDSVSSRAFFDTKEVLLRMSCPYTSSQNGKAERILQTINNMLRSLLFQASILARYKGRRAPHRHISAEPPPYRGDQHDQSILHPPWSRPLL